MLSLHNVQVRGNEADPTLQLLEADPVLSPFKYFVSPSDHGWVAVYPQRIDKGPKVAKTLSQKLHTDALCLRTYADKAFLYAYFRHGEKHDEFCSSPEAMRQVQEMDDELSELVQQWERGEIEQNEYRQRTHQYLENFTLRKARTLADVERQIRGLSPERATERAAETVMGEFCGKDGQDVLIEFVRRKFPDRAAKLLGALHSAGRSSTGGKPQKLQNLVKDVDALERLLGSNGSAADLLEKFASLLGMPRAVSSYQHLASDPSDVYQVG